MARPTNDERLAKIHAEAIKEFDEIQAAMRDERMQCLEDRRFYSLAGAQWAGALGEQFENKLKIEANLIHLSVIRIFSEYRNNRITVDFVPRPGSKNPAIADKLADTLDGLFRADEQDSCAEEAYDNAFEEATGGGYGAMRLRCEYEDESDDENDRQRIRIEPIFDADSSVFFDLDAKRQDKSDAKRCWVLTSMTPAAYKEAYGDDPASWPKEIQQTEFDWATPDVVFVAEHYRIEERRDTVRTWQGLDGSEQRVKDSEFETTEDREANAAEMRARGFREVRSKKVTRQRCHKYLLSGSKILEDCGEIAGPNIPIVPVYGKRWFVDNVERCMGHVRLPKDMQRLINMQLSKVGELSALSSTEKPIFTPEQMAGHAPMWSEDNVKNNPYLLVNAVKDMNGNPAAIGPQAYTKAPSIPPATAALLTIGQSYMESMLGNQQKGDELHANVPAQAVEMIHNRLDMQPFIYMSNMAKAVRRVGQVWLGMAKEVMPEENREMKVIGADDEPGTVMLNRPVMDENGEVTYENDLSCADCEVYVDVGPTSVSKRASIVRTATGMMAFAQTPEMQQLLSHLALMNMEGEGMADVRRYSRRTLLAMGVVQPTEEEAAELANAAQNAKPDANEEYLKAAAEQAVADAMAKRAQAILSVAKTEETKAKTAETLAGIGRDDRAQVVKTVEAIGNAMAQNQPQQTLQP